jgi:hypothetical protein
MDPENAGREKAGNKVFRKIPEKNSISPLSGSPLR